MARFGKCGITFPNLTSTIIITICVQHLTFVICYAIIPCCYIIFNYYFIYSTCDETLSTCGSWESKSIDLSDCESIQDGAEEKLCNHLNTWRITGILSLIAVLIGGGLVFAASCCQMVTCGCCGNSFYETTKDVSGSIIRRQYSRRRWRLGLLLCLRCIRWMGSRLYY